MDRERARVELDMMISDFENAGVPEADIAGRVIPSPQQMCEERLRMVREDIDRSRVPDPLDVEEAIARERARRTFLTVDQPRVEINSLGEPIIKGAPVSKLTVGGERLGDDVLLALGVKDVEDEPEVTSPDPLVEAMDNLGKPASESTPVLRTEDTPRASGQKSFLERPIDEVLSLVAARMEPGRARTFTEGLAARARGE